MIEWAIVNPQLFFVLLGVLIIIALLLLANNKLVLGFIVGILAMSINFTFLFNSIAIEQNFDTVVSTTQIDILKVDLPSHANPVVTYVNDGVLVSVEYNDPIKVSNEITKPSATLEVRENLHGDTKDVISNLTVPISLIQ